jgi:hypothetical protein
MERYYMNLDNPFAITHGEIDCLLPYMPEERFMRNYDLPQKKQKFKTTPVPDFSKMTMKERIAFIEQDWHRRINGEWWLINGQPIYLTGINLYFLDRWTTQSGMRPEFRISQTKIFQTWFHVTRDKDCCGLFVLKGRRAYLTEVRLAVSLELATRKTNRNIGMVRSLVKHEKPIIWGCCTSCIGKLI